MDEGLKLCDARGPAVRRLRESCFQGGKADDIEEQGLLLDLTIGFEKAVWMLRRLLQVQKDWQAKLQGSNRSPGTDRRVEPRPLDPTDIPDSEVLQPG